MKQNLKFLFHKLHLLDDQRFFLAFDIQILLPWQENKMAYLRL